MKRKKLKGSKNNKSELLSNKSKPSFNFLALLKISSFPILQTPGIYSLCSTLAV
jgi:hypothetical protein